MEQEKKQAVALMRYSAIAPLITGTQEDYESLSAYFRTASAKGIKAPDGSIRHYSPGTLEKWYLSYRKSGFDALVPTGRSDCGVSRKIDEDLKEQIIYLKHHYPRMSAAAIYKQLQDNGSIRSGQLSESTVCRFINQLVLQERLTNNQDMRRYERPHINEVWCGDSSAGPYLKTGDGKKHRVYVIALIDDASRFILAADVFFNDTFVNLMSVMKSAVSGGTEAYSQTVLFQPVFHLDLTGYQTVPCRHRRSCRLLAHTVLKPFFPVWSYHSRTHLPDLRSLLF